MKKIKLIHDYIRFVAGKYQSGAYSPERTDLAIHVASLQFFNELLDDYLGSKSNAHLFQPLMQVLAPINRIGAYDTEGHIVERVEDFDTGKKIDLVKINEIGFLKDDSIAGPTLDEPVAYMSFDGLRVEPRTYTKQIRVYTIKKPDAPKYAFEKVGNNYVYNEGATKDIEWPEQAIPILANRVVGVMGISTNDGNLVQYSQWKESRETEQR